MQEIDWSNKEEVLEYLRNGGQEVHKIDESLLAKWSFVREAGRIEPYIFDIADIDLVYTHSEDIDRILEEVKEEKYRKISSVIDTRTEIDEIQAKLDDDRSGYISSSIIDIDGTPVIDSKIIEAMWMSDLRDLDCAEMVLECYIVEDANNEYNPFTSAISFDGHNSGITSVKNVDGRDVTPQDFDFYEIFGNKSYTDLVKRLIKIHGQEFIMNKYGRLIREKVPAYALELDNLDLSTQEGIDFLIDNYPKGYAGRHISIDKMLEELDKRCEEVRKISRRRSRR